MKESTKIITQIVKEFIYGKMGKSTKDFLKMGRDMVMGNIFIQTETFSKVFSPIISNKVKESTDGMMAEFIKDITKTI